jgi:hypothetical protein
MEYRLRALLSLALLASSLVICCVDSKQSTPDLAKTSFLTYENQNHKIKINYPSDWEKIEDYLGVVMFSTPVKYRENSMLVIFSEEVSDGSYSLNNLTETHLIIAKNESGFKLLELTNTTLSGYPAKRTAYTFTDKYTFFQLWVDTIKNNKTYSVFYSTIDEDRYLHNLPIAEEMIKSFEIT